MDFANRLANHAALWAALRVISLLHSVQKEGKRLVVHPDVDYDGLVDNCFDIMEMTEDYPGIAEG
jgi:hypothetical protein